MGGVNLSCDGTITRIIVETSRKPSASYSYLTAPLRLVVDFNNAILKMDNRVFENLPEGLVSRIEVGQYRGGKDPVTRAVFYILSKGEGISAKAEEKSYVMEIITRGYPKMEWSSTEVGEVEKTKEAKPAEPESVAPAPEAEKTKPALPETTVAETLVPPPPGKTSTYQRVLADFIPHKTDPFVMQTPQKERPIGAKIYPDADAVTLVGIIKQEGSYKALVEDNMGFGHLLGVGDSVLNGNTVAVTDTSVSFIVEEFGWRRRINLQLKGREEE